MKLSITILALCLAICAVSSVSADGQSCTILDAASMYPLQQTPTQPTQVDISVAGTSERGEIEIHVSDSRLNCWTEFGITICGNGAYDYIIYMESRNGLITLTSLANIPSDQSSGNATNMVIVGSWSQDDVIQITVSNSFHIFLRGFNSDVFAQGGYVGKLEPLPHPISQNGPHGNGSSSAHHGALPPRRLVGRTYSWSVAFINDGPQAYQLELINQPIDSSISNLGGGARTMSGTNPTGISPIGYTSQVGGTLEGVKFMNGSIYSDVLTFTDVPNRHSDTGSFIGQYRAFDIPNLYHVKMGFVYTAVPNVRYGLVDFDILCN